MRGLIAAAVLVAMTGAAWADVQNSKHNLSSSGPGQMRAPGESKICVFCHTPHRAAPAAPLWNHETSVLGSYATYSSSTLKVNSPLGQPTGSSKLCLSCHDGTIAIGQTVNDGLIKILNAGPAGRMPFGASVVGTDLTDDHPISFRPNTSSMELVNPMPGDPVRLDESGNIQCTSCHDPHEENKDPLTRKFLVKSNKDAALCLSCHQMTGWTNSTHQISQARFTKSQGAHTDYDTVAGNGCSSCHRPHSGGHPERLLKGREEANCLGCHNGSVASTDIAAAYAKPFGHPTLTTTPSVHDAAESTTHPTRSMPETNPAAPRHAECSDCHNPHASTVTASVGAGISGAMAGAWGVDGDGIERRPARAEYEICYKCHGDAANKPQPAGLPHPPYARRQVVQFNVRLEFDPLNPSHHAVEAPGRNPDVPSLLPGYTTASTISCTDCHNNDSGPGAGGNGPNGPHGSNHRYMLERNLLTGSGQRGSSFSTMYALCFKCHSESSILSDETFPAHRLHIDDEGASCSVCHDPHGVSATQGNALGNSHLINFDTRVVRSNSIGELRFEDRGSRRGACYLTCHNREHNPEEY